MASSKFVVDVGARALRAKLRHDDFNGPFSRTDHHSAEADFLQKCSKEILQAPKEILAGPDRRFHEGDLCCRELASQKTQLCGRVQLPDPINRAI
jgi:hypothetical protein